MLDFIAEVAWLTIQYEAIRRACIAQGVILSKKDWIEKPGYQIALTPVQLMEVIKARIPFQIIALAAKPPVLGAMHLPLPNGRLVQ